MENERLAEVHKELQAISIRLGEAHAFAWGGITTLSRDVRTRQDQMMLQVAQKFAEGFVAIKSQIDEVIKKVEQVK